MPASMPLCGTSADVCRLSNPVAIIGNTNLAVHATALRVLEQLGVQWDSCSIDTLDLAGLAAAGADRQVLQ